MGDARSCSQNIPDSMWGHKCSCKATVVEDGKPYCTRHSRAGREKQKAKSEIKYQAQRKEWEDKWKRESAIMYITGNFSTELLDSHKDVIREFIESLEAQKEGM